MSMHTPGPWDRRSTYNTLTDEIGVRGKALATVWVRRSDGVLSDESRIVTDEEGESNARLIAAAPDLLEAVRITIGNVKSLGPAGALDDVPYAPYREWLRMLEDTLAKATGGAA